MMLSVYFTADSPHSPLMYRNGGPHFSLYTTANIFQNKLLLFMYKKPIVLSIYFETNYPHLYSEPMVSCCVCIVRRLPTAMY